MHLRVQTLCMLIGILFLPMAAFAEDVGPKMVPDSADGVQDDTSAGWQPFLKANANFALGQSKNVPGSTDGTSLQFGYLINGGLDYLSPSRRHEWANTLLWELGYTRTPVVDAFIKSLDNIDFKTTYLYHIPAAPWFGPFVSLRATTPMLASYEVRADPTNVIRLEVREVQYVDGAGNPTDGDGGPPIDPTHPSVEQYSSAEKIDLTKAFAPFVFRQSAGVFAVPVDKTEFKLDMRLGAGAWEIFARKGFVLEDNEDTPDYLELRRLEDSVQMGAEFGIVAKGVLKEYVNYGLSALFMQPFVHNSDTQLSGIDLLNMEFEALLGITLWRFLSVNYSFKAYKQPLIVDDWQIQNNLLIAVGFDLVKSKPAPAAEPLVCPECPACPEPTPTEAEVVNEDADSQKDDAGEADPEVGESDSTATVEVDTESVSVEPAPSTESAGDISSPSQSGDGDSQPEGTSASDGDGPDTSEPPVTP